MLEFVERVIDGIRKARYTIMHPNAADIFVGDHNCMSLCALLDSLRFAAQFPFARSKFNLT